MKPSLAGRKLAAAGALWFIAAGLACQASAAAVDEVVLKNGRKYTGTIVSDTADSLVLAIDGGTVRIPRDAVQSPPYFGPPDAEEPATEETSPEAVSVPATPLPSVKEALEWLQNFPWSSPLVQVPVQVTDRGRWPFLPALAFSSGQFFRLSVYGDPAHPAAIEVSLPPGATDAWAAKGRLLEYMFGLVPGLAVDSRFATLNIRGDSFAVGDLWFAITDTGSAEAPGRWTVVIMHERSLTPARASLEELEAISEPLVTAIIEPDQPRSWQKGSWTRQELEGLERSSSTAAPLPVADAAVSPTDTQVRQWLALNSTRVFIRSFARVRGRYVPSEEAWLPEE